MLFVHHILQMSEHLKKYEKDQHQSTNMIDSGRGAMNAVAFTPKLSFPNMKNY